MTEERNGTPKNFNISFEQAFWKHGQSGSECNLCFAWLFDRLDGSGIGKQGLENTQELKVVYAKQA